MFQSVSEDDRVSPAEGDRQTYKEAQHDHDESVISEENGRKIIRFKRDLQQS
jgi:hypothetical protein